VADKGVPAALFMALSRTLMRSVAISRVWPATTLARVNELIFADAQTDLFVTVLYAVWEPDQGLLRYVLAGHNPPVWVGPDRAPQLLPGRGVALGVFDEVTYQEHEVRLAPGDVLVLYTDGLPDAVNAGGEEFGMKRVMEIVHRSYTQSASAIVDALTSAVSVHAGIVEPFDDVTMTVIKRQPLAGERLN
jgi:serine phosphatase RsbU (regulator of sigma subunit)